jgi:nitrogen-specific signal transduction histidine kinase/CheY-like chemotaxis protein
MSRDITHESELESQLRQSQRLDALGTLAGGIAHDFNNILGAIIGYTELAKEEASPQGHTDRYLKEVLHASSRAKELIQQILTFTRRVDTERKAVLPQLVVHETLKLLRSSIPSSIEIVQDIEPDVDAILADPTQIHQIVMNLCTNAYQAMSPGEGTLTVKLKPVEISDRRAARYPQLRNQACMELTISDTGCGMDREIMDCIFDPFFTTKQHEKGTGLGLSTVHGIVQSLDGAISVNSQPGKGSTFTVYLPTLQEVSEQRADTRGPIPVGKGEHILLVDDEEALRESCQLRLAALGYKVTTCMLASEALKLFEEDPWSFNLVLTDYSMPKMNGVTLARELLSIRPDLPIVLVTGNHESVLDSEVEELGLSAFLKKPLDADLLGRTIWEILSGMDQATEETSSDTGLVNAQV